MCWVPGVAVHFAFFLFCNVHSSTFSLFLSQGFMLGGLRGPLDMQDPSLIYTSGPVIPEAFAFPRTALSLLRKQGLS